MMARHADKQTTSLRYGWTTGACATAAARAAVTALMTGEFPDPVTIRLPRGKTPAFALAHEKQGAGFAEAGIVKDAGDDPDVTHQALVIARVRRGVAGSGVTFRAGKGVGVVTRPGLPLEVGEAAINPAPRAMIREAVIETATAHGEAGDVIVEIAIPDGEKLARHTWNPRLGIIGGLSVLGVTGIVVPYSCAAWIDAIHRGIDVARAADIHHVAGCAGDISEQAVREFYDLPEVALLDMGDFAGGLLKYLRRNPLPWLTIGGGFAKISKLAAGRLDLHSGRSTVDFDFLAGIAHDLNMPDEQRTRIQNGTSAGEVLLAAGDHSAALAHEVAVQAQTKAMHVLDKTNAPIRLDVMIVNRQGDIIAHALPHPTSVQ